MHNIIPQRFKELYISNLDTYFAMARGYRCNVIKFSFYMDLLKTVDKRQNLKEMSKVLLQGREG